jgi:hypothetical protein
MASTQVAHIERLGVVVVVPVARLAASGDFAGPDGRSLAGEVPRRLLLGVFGVLASTSLKDAVAVAGVVDPLPLGHRTGDSIAIESSVPAGEVGASV